ncbi:MAG: ParB/RepB/Spo0J family partition protein [Candidatus Azobacteroides sp.]|nr:ParB/RepB/Spo0J family partition protein [Candidatus Azobacteroides sp.]
MSKKSALGRGLSALIDTDNISTKGSSSINEIELSKIKPNPSQPRREFDEESLADLSSSIKAIGIIQPITLREIGDEMYQIIAGERRYRAATLAGLETIPAYIKKAEDDMVMEMALIENIQREDLNAVEIALAYQNLIEVHGLTQEKLSERVGKKRTTIANYLRLLKLPSQIQIGLKNKEIDMGHARALISIEDPSVQLMVYEQILEYNFSVRKVEEIAREINEGGEPEDIKKSGKNPSVSKNNLPEEYELLREHLSNFFNTKVKFACDKKGKGKITIPFTDEQELEHIMGLFDTLGS